MEGDEYEEEKIDVIFEDGWYKYQILVGKDLQNAFNILENCL